MGVMGERSIFVLGQRLPISHVEPVEVAKSVPKRVLSYVPTGHYNRRGILGICPISKYLFSPARYKTIIRQPRDFKMGKYNQFPEYWPHQVDLLSIAVKWLTTIAVVGSAITSLWLLWDPYRAKILAVASPEPDQPRVENQNHSPAELD